MAILKSWFEFSGSAMVMARPKQRSRFNTGLLENEIDMVIARTMSGGKLLL